MRPEEAPVGRQGTPQPRFPGVGERGVADGHVHLVGPCLPCHAAHLGHGVAAAHDQPPAALPQTGVQVGQAVGEEGQPVGRGESGPVDGRVPDEQRHDLVRRFHGGAQRRMVVQAEVGGEEDDGDGHGVTPGIGHRAERGASRPVRRPSPRRFFRRSVRCSAPCRRRRRRGTAPRPTSTTAPRDPAGGRGRAGGSGSARRRPARCASPARRDRAAASRRAAGAGSPLDLLDPPEVERVADPEPLGVASATAQSHPADEPVEPAAYGPGQWEGVPAVLTADALDDLPQGVRVGVDGPFAFIGVEAAARPVGVGGQRIAGGSGQ